MTIPISSGQDMFTSGVAPRTLTPCGKWCRLCERNKVWSRNLALHVKRRRYMHPHTVRMV